MTFHFIRPYFLLLFIPMGYFIFKIIKNKNYNNPWAKICDEDLLKELVINKNNIKTKLPIYLLSIGWALGVIALAGPSFREISQPVYKSSQSVVVVLDQSPSMLNTDIAPTRNQRAKYKLIDILRKESAGRLGLVVFSDEAYTVSPLTYDSHIIESMVPELTPFIMPSQGNNIFAGLEQGLKLLKSGDGLHGRLILITDHNPTAQDYKLAKQIKSQGYYLSVLGMGNNIDPNQLKKLAQLGNGIYHTFTNTDLDINTILPKNNNKILNKKSKINTLKYQDNGLWFLWPLGILILFSWRRGWFDEVAR